MKTILLSLAACFALAASAQQAPASDKATRLTALPPGKTAEKTENNEDGKIRAYYESYCQWSRSCPPMDSMDIYPGLFRLQFAVSPSGSPLEDSIIYCGANAYEEYADYGPANGVFCSVNEPEPDRAADCELDTQRYFILADKGKARELVECAGDTPMGSPAVALADGQSIAGKGWKCLREGQTLRCLNDDGHGFILSESKQQLIKP